MAGIRRVSYLLKPLLLMAPMVLMAFRTERMWMWITDHQIALGNVIFLTDINIAFLRFR